jgi:hypothetical protein
MRTDLKHWLDKDGFLHLVPNFHDKPAINQTTNGALYTGTYIVLRYRANLLTIQDVHDFTESLIHLYNPETKEWRNHSISKWNEFSLDNFTGIATALKCCMKFLEKKNFQKSEVYHKCEYYMAAIPYYHWQLDHPKDFIYLGQLKTPFLFYFFWTIISVVSPVLFIMFFNLFLSPEISLVLSFLIYFVIYWFDRIAMIVSCYQTFKYKNDVPIIKTDGKILAFLRFTATKMPITEYICTWLIKNKKHKTEDNTFSFGKWSEVFYMYYRNAKHPNRKLMRELDE